VYDAAQLLSDVKAAEILRDKNGDFCGLAYDDATGKLIKPGMLVKGHVTAGYGIALDVDPLTEPEASFLLTNRLQAHAAATLAKMPWVGNLSDARQRAVIELSFNLGDGGLQAFDTFLSLLRQGQFDAAADDLAGTKWAKQTKDRAARIVAQIRNG
jgi:GH24 family phage-related lysozyme (muramidase)